LPAYIKAWHYYAGYEPDGVFKWVVPKELIEASDTIGFHYIDASLYGAYPDDSLDDTQALQKCIDSVSKSKGLFILLHPGRYLQSKDLDWTHYMDYRIHDGIRVPSTFAHFLFAYIVDKAEFQQSHKAVQVVYLRAKQKNK
jgi:hypothetical protein